MGRLGDVLGMLLGATVLDGVLLGYLGTVVLLLPLRALARSNRGPPGTEGNRSALEGFFRRDGVRWTLVTMASVVVVLLNAAAFEAAAPYLAVVGTVFGTLVFWKVSDWNWKRIWA